MVISPRLFCPLAASLTLFIAGCAAPPVSKPEPTADVQTPPDRGTVVLAGRDGSIRTASLPGMVPAILRPGAEADPPVPFAVAGPDSLGRVAVVDASPAGRGHTLTLLTPDGSPPHVVFTRAGDPTRDHAVGGSLALSPMAAKVAFVSGPDPLRPGLPLSQGMLEVWDAATSTRLIPPPDPTAIDLNFQEPATRPARPKDARLVFDSGLAWFPDGRRLAIVQSVLTDPLPDGGTGPDGFGAAFAGWQDVPAVYVLDTVGGNEQFLSVGVHPVVSPDGRAVYVSDLRAPRPDGSLGVRWRKIDLGTFQPAPADLPPNGTVVAQVGPQKFLFLTPAKGAAPGRRTPLTLKLGANDATAETLIESLDPDTRVSFGGEPR